MIIKGKSRGLPQNLGTYLTANEENERAEIIEVRGTVAQDVSGALKEMDALACGTKCLLPLYHAQISPEPPHRLDETQRKAAVDALEKSLGFEGHPRVVVVHEKKDREHLHVVWARVNPETLKVVSMSFNYRKNEEVARELERQFGHPRVQGAHAEREGVERPNRTPSRAELRQEERTGIKSKRVRGEVTAIFRASDNAEAFKAGLEVRRYILAKGDHRDFVIVDRGGGVHSLARRIEGIKAADLREFMTSINQENLPTAALAQAFAKQRAESREEAMLERSYDRGEDYVSQSRAALKDHIARQEDLDRRSADEPKRTSDEELLRRQAEETTRRQESERRAAESPSAKFSESAAEMTDAKQERFNRLLNAIDDEHERDDHDPDRQREAPGGGRTRSR